MTFDSWRSELYHYGVKGMHWGVRRTAEELGHITEGSSKGVSAIENIKNRKTPKNNPKAKTLSDDELRKSVNRMILEKQYSDLTRKDTSRGFETVKDILAVIGSLAAVTVSGVSLYSSLKYGEDGEPKKKK